MERHRHQEHGNGPVAGWPDPELGRDRGHLDSCSSIESMKFFRGTSIRAWPAELERRQPENAEHRAQLEHAHRARVALRAQIAAETTQRLDHQLSKLRDIARLLELGNESN